MLKLINVNKTFNKGTVNEKKAISSLNFEMEKGDFVTIIGGNGAGKSTMLNLISGTLLPDSGKIFLDNKDITYQKEHKRAKEIGRLFQDPLKGTAPSMTIEENMCLAFARGSKMGITMGTNKKDREMFKEALSMLGLGLEDRLKTKMGLLSGGQRQAVTLLMATLRTPKLLLLDEHTAALDPATAEKVLDITEKIVGENNITTLMITHNIKSALEIGKRTIMMNNGNIVLDISGDERKNMSVEDVLKLFRQKSNEELDNDRMLLV